MVQSSIMKIHAEFAGVTDQIPARIEGFENYREHLQGMKDGLPAMNFEDYKQQEALRLDYEIKMTGVALKILNKLEKTHQLDS